MRNHQGNLSLLSDKSVVINYSTIAQTWFAIDISPNRYIFLDRRDLNGQIRQ